MSRAHQAKRRLIERFGLAPHPEGGYYRETHRDSAGVLRVTTSPVSAGVKDPETIYRIGVAIDDLH